MPTAFMFTPEAPAADYGPQLPTEEDLRQLDEEARLQAWLCEEAAPASPEELQYAIRAAAGAVAAARLIIE